MIHKMNLIKAAFLTRSMVLVCVLLTACNSFGQAGSGVNPSPVVTNTAVPEPIQTQVVSTFIPPTLVSQTSSTHIESSSPSLGETNTPILIEEVDFSAIPTESPFQICSPLSLHPLKELREITSDPYRPPPPGREERHHGIDFSYYRHGDRLTIQGVGVQSVLPGKVAASLVESYPYGNMVIIETPYSALPGSIVDLLSISAGQSLYTLYAHMDQPPLVLTGENVASCQALGQVGKSGNAVEPHLHLEMRVGPPGVVFRSLGYYQANNTKEERDNYVRWRTGGEFNHFDPMLILRDAAKLMGEIE